MNLCRLTWNKSFIESNLNTRFVLTTGSLPVILLAIVIYIVAKKVHIFFHVLKDAKEKLAVSNSKKGLVLLVAMVRKHQHKWKSRQTSM